jgi:DNA-binding LacI/PurR family transcriptional regulator
MVVAGRKITSSASSHGKLMMNPPAPLRPGPPRATITEVAKLAGVSRQTVSRVARGVPGVSDETTARVQRAIEQLGYRPHAVARALSSGSSRTIGVLTHAVGNAGAAIVVLSGVERAASEAGYAVSLASIGDFDGTTVRNGIDRLLRAGCDGIIVMATWTSDADALRDLALTVPVVTTSQVEGFTGPTIHNDTEAAARIAVGHLIDLGHRRIAHVAGPAGWSAARHRREAWRSTMEGAGLEANPVLTGDWTAGSGYRAGLELAGDPDVTAVFVANDEMALGVLHAVGSAGRTVPDDLSVVGFDNSEIAGHFSPPLTTVGFDSRAQSARAVDALIALIEGRSVDPQPPLSPTLTIRNSTAPPSALIGPAAHQPRHSLRPA